MIIGAISSKRSRFLHGDAELAEFPPRQAAAEAQDQAALAECIQQRGLFRDAQRLDVPRQDDGAGGQQDKLGPRRDIGKVDEIIRAERIVFEMVLDDPDVIIAEFIRQHRLPDFLIIDLLITDALQAEARHDLDNPDFHDILLCLSP